MIYQLPSMLETLRQVRKDCRLSQLELALRLGVSQRHVSFVESGRSKPSRDLLVAWLQELNAPLILRNDILLQAGYAPAYNTTQLNDPTLTQVNDALKQLLSAHDPQPAMILDAQWNLLRLNRGGQWLAAALMPGMGAQPGDQTGDQPLNLLDMLIHPDGFTKPITNLHAVGPAFLTRLRHEASAQPSITPKVDAFAALLDARLGTQYAQNKSRKSGLPPTDPVLTTHYATQYGELSFFSMFTTFGTPQDITLASLRVEHLFAADTTTYAVLKEQIQ